jgi:hypothetical protein
LFTLEALSNIVILSLVHGLLAESAVTRTFIEYTLPWRVERVKTNSVLPQLVMKVVFTVKTSLTLLYAGVGKVQRRWWRRR